MAADVDRPPRWLTIPLTHRRLPAMAAVLAIVLTLPALGAGWLLDDYYHRVVLLGVPPFRDLLGPPGEMFRFFRGDPARTGRAMDIGIFPWWTDPLIKAEFLQAVTVATHRLDYRLWPDSAAMMHARSLLWYAALVAATAVLYRRLMGRTTTAGVAAVLFAIDDAHGGPAGWIANRNSLIAATFGVLDHSRRPRADVADVLRKLATLLRGAGRDDEVRFIEARAEETGPNVSQ